jgi:G3E family GTPase
MAIFPQPGVPPDAANPAAAAEAWQMLSGILEAARIVPGVQRAAPGSLPLTVIGGFLGAGKTTLLSHLLRGDHGRRIAVLVNDFGAINIDAELVRSRTEDTISLANGCACCTVAGDLARALVALAQRADPPDAIVLEASGLADPRGIAQVALANPALRLDGIVTVVDAETLLERSNDPACRDTFFAQVAGADLVVLNKLDLVASGARARAWLEERAPGSRVIAARHAEVPVEVVLGIDTARDMQREPPTAPGHAQPFASWSASGDAPLERARFLAMMREIDGELLRAKAILALADDAAHRTVYQQVGRRWSLARGEPWEGAPRHSRLVLIGPAHALEQAQLGRRFAACAA